MGVFSCGIFYSGYSTIYNYCIKNISNNNESGFWQETEHLQY